MQLKDGTEHVLVKKLHSIDQGRFIEQEIERFLKIKDRYACDEWQEGLD